jgi:DNA-binding MarR family transcriptional regulator
MFESGSAASILGDLSQEEFMVWAGFVQAHAAIARGLDADLRAAHGLALSEFEILLWLSHESCARMRMAELADTVQLSPSGLSRAVERLEARGLVTRHRFADDRRGAFAKLTASGIDLLQRAGATQAAGIRRLFLEYLTPEDLQAFGPAWMRVLAANERSCSWSGSSPDDAPPTLCPCAEDADHDDQREES